MLKNGLSFMFQGAFPQILAVVTGTISAISDGMQYGWTAPTIPLLHLPTSPVQITENHAAWLESICMLGGITGLPITIYAVDKIGRKRTILLSCITNLIVWILIGVANRVEYLLVARFFTGLAADVNFVAAPMYIAEIADKKIRGFLAGMIYLMMLLGILIIYSTGPFLPIYGSAAIGASILLFELVTFPFMPESPYFLLYKNRPEAAKRSLQRLRGTEDVDEELAEIAQAVQRQKAEQGRPQDLFLIKSNRRAVLIMTVLNAAQHFSGISVMLMNLHMILETAGAIHISSNTAAIIFSAVMLTAASSASFIIDKYGRKILLTISSLLTGLALLTIAIYFALKNGGIDVTGVSWVPTVAVMVYAAVFKLGLGMVPIVLTAELFPTEVKAMGMTLADACYLGFGFISLQIYQALAGPFGVHVPFFIFAASCLFTAIFCAFIIPETRGKTLEEIQFMLKGEPYQRHDAKTESIHSNDASCS